MLISHGDSAIIGGPGCTVSRVKGIKHITGKIGFPEPIKPFGVVFPKQGEARALALRQMRVIGHSLGRKIIG